MRAIQRLIGFFRRKQFWRINLENYYSSNEYAETLGYADENIEISGVEELHQQIERVRSDYINRMEQFINTVSPTEASLYTRLEKANKIKYLCKLGDLAAVVWFFIALKLGSAWHSSGGTLLLIFTEMLAFLVIGIGLLLGIITKITETAFEKKYQSQVQIIENQLNQINENHQYDLVAIYNEIDILYLDSLEPAHREAVLARRDRQRQHEEEMEQRERHHREEMEQREHQHKEIVNEQRQTRQAAEEMLRAEYESLAIEKEREKRYWQSR